MSKWVKYLAVGMFLLNIPTFALTAFGSTAGSLASALSFLSLLVYAILAKRFVLLKIFLLIGLSYFVISGLQFYSGEETKYIAMFQKYILIALFGAALADDFTKEELMTYLLVGAGSIIVNAVFFSDDYGRYSGVYLDPNAAGSVCIIGYALTFGFANGRLKYFAQFLFTFAGLITFSRTFIVIWVVINLISLRLNPKNIKIFILGTLVIVMVIGLSQALNFNPQRFNQLKSIVGQAEVAEGEIGRDSRTATWAIFYPYIFEKPILGSGFGAFQGRNNISRIGPHNSFLLVLGEAGIFAFLIILGFYLYLLKQGVHLFRSASHLLMMSIGLFLFLITNHNYFTAYYLIFISMWVYLEIKKIPHYEN